jgi:hypothetical protein
VSTSTPGIETERRLDRTALALGIAIGSVLGAGILWILETLLPWGWDGTAPPLAVRGSIAVVALTIMAFLVVRIWWWFRVQRPARFLRSWATNFFVGGTGMLAGGMTLEIGFDLPWLHTHVQYDGAGWVSGVVAAVCVVCAMICVLRYVDRFPPGTI